MSDQYKQIVETGKRMLKQSNRHTQYPLFVIQDTERRAPSIHDDPDGYEKDDDGQDQPYVEATVFNLKGGVFLTEEAAQKHIDENHYHYTNPRIYVISAWRNPEMVAVMQQIIKTTEQEVPSHYE